MASSDKDDVLVCSPHPQNISAQYAPVIDRYLAHVDVKKLATPFPILGPMFGFDRNAVIRQTGRTIIEHCVILGRPVTPSETQAIAYHHSRFVRTASFGIPVGIFAGWLCERNTRSTFKFPFWRVDYRPDGTGRFNPHKFGPLKGRAAFAAWHMLRRSSYVFLGVIFGTVIYAAWASQIYMMGVRSDPAFSDFKAAAKKMTEGDRTKLLYKAPTIGDLENMVHLALGNGPSPEGTPSQPGKYLELFKIKDAQPADSYEAWAAQQDAPWQQQQQQQQQEPQQRQQQIPFSQDWRSSRQTDSSPFDFDDASPTAGAPPEETAPPARNAWDNLRQKGPTQHAPAPARGQRQQATTAGDAWATRRSAPSEGAQDPSSRGESFSFSSANEEKQLARQDAQREFDARIDRERRGEDFDDSRRW